MAGRPPQYIPPPPPPPPPGYGDAAFGARPTSGKGIAALICGLVGLVGVFCWLPAIASLVGVVLGILAIIETGREGTRSGRGLAIAGTIVSVLAVVAMGAWISFALYMTKQGQEDMEAAIAGQLDADQRMILERMRRYHDENEKSLGPGGPILADNQVTFPANTPRVNNHPVDARGRVVGALKLEHLVRDEDLGFGTYTGSGSGWDLTVTGKDSAILRAKDWDGSVLREITVQDIGRNQYAQTIP